MMNTKYIGAIAAVLACVGIVGSVCGQDLTPLYSAQTNTGTAVAGDYSWVSIPMEDAFGTRSESAKIGLRYADTNGTYAVEVWVDVAGTATKILTVDSGGIDVVGGVDGSTGSDGTFTIIQDSVTNTLTITGGSVTAIVNP